MILNYFSKISSSKEGSTSFLRPLKPPFFKAFYVSLASLSLSKASSGCRRPRRPRFSNSLFPSWDSYFVSHNFTHQPRWPWTKNGTSWWNMLVKNFLNVIEDKNWSISVKISTFNFIDIHQHTISRTYGFFANIFHHHLSPTLEQPFNLPDLLTTSMVLQ